MGANEISNRVEASAWIAAAGQSEPESPSSIVKASDFFFRSISGFVNRIEIAGAEVGDNWDDVEQLGIALFLDRNYARKDTTMLLQPIDSLRPALNQPAITLPLNYEGPLRVLPMSLAGFEALKTFGPQPLPGSLDPYSVLLVVADLTKFQLAGVGLEFGIEVLRMPDYNGGPTTVIIQTA